MDPNFKGRLKYYALVLCAIVVIAGIMNMNGPRVEGGVLRYALTDTEGNLITHDAPEIQGKVRIVNLWGVWCPPCRNEIPHLVDLQNRYRDQGLEIIAAEFSMGTPSSEEEHREYLKEIKERMGINYTLVAGGSTDQVYEAFLDLRNMQGFPTSIFIGRDGKVVHITTGFTPSDVKKYDKWIQELLAKSN